MKPNTIQHFTEGIRCVFDTWSFIIFDNIKNHVFVWFIITHCAFWQYVQDPERFSSDALLEPLDTLAELCLFSYS